jgi:hypothetical protein
VGVDPIEGNYFRNASAFRGFNNLFTSRATSYAMIAVPTVLYSTATATRNPKRLNVSLVAVDAGPPGMRTAERRNGGRLPKVPPRTECEDPDAGPIGSIRSAPV